MLRKSSPPIEPRRFDAPITATFDGAKKGRSDASRIEAFRQTFLDEARIGAALNHPNVVHVYDVDEHEGVPYIAMEYIVGEELNQLCRRGLALERFLPLEHAIELMRQAAAGMGYFHHRRGGSPGGVGTRIELSLSQDELASWTGATRETVSRALRLMRQLGWVATEHRAITILDVRA